MLHLCPFIVALFSIRPVATEYIRDRVPFPVRGISV